MSLHLAPNAPWVILALASLALAALGLWAYRFALPPLPALARRILPALRVVALLVLLWLLAQPVWERAGAGAAARVVVLVDRSWSMDLPAGGSGSPGTRSAAAEALTRELGAALRGRAALREMPFAGALGVDSTWLATRSATAMGGALASLGLAGAGRELGGVIVVSDGIVNAGQDPVAAARSLGVPVHAVVVGRSGVPDRAVVGVEGPSGVRVGESAPVRVRVVTSERDGGPLGVRLLEGGREIARGVAISPGGGAEATVELRATPTRPGLALWTAQLDSLPGELTTANNARQLALEVAPGTLGVLVLAAELSWDLAFLRRALAGDSTLSLSTRVRRRGGWEAAESARPAGAPGAADLRGKAVLVLDGLGPADLGPEFEDAVGAFVRGGGGLLALGGSGPGLARLRRGKLAADLGPAEGAVGARPGGSPAPALEARELLAWDDDPARGERAWRAAAPLSDVIPIGPGAGDRVLLGSGGEGPPLMLARRVGRGQALLVNGTGFWRWSLSGYDELSGERGRRLWRRLVRWLAEPVQGEPLRVRPERWLAARGEPVRLLASLQDRDFRPIGGARVEGEIQDAAGRRRAIRFAPREAGSYVAALADLPPGRYRVSARATRGGGELGSAGSEFAVDRWSLEEVRTEPDSAAMAAVAAATGGRVAPAAEIGSWARALPTGALARARTESVRLWESPWVFALVVMALGLEWAWRRRSGLP